MSKTSNIKEFADIICRRVKEALPEELKEAEVRAASLDIWNDGQRTVLLITRPWGGVTTGFCLDRHYKQYYDGIVTLEHVLSKIINDRRIYCMPTDNGFGVPGLQGGAVIYA